MRITPATVSLEEEEHLPFYTLEALLDGVTEENRHGKIDWGPSVGNEFLAAETPVILYEGVVCCDY